MKRKSFIFLFALIFMIAVSLSAVSADNSTDVISGEVSGGVEVAAENPWNTTGELSYDIPSDAKEIKTANVYVNVYSGSAQPTYGAIANVSLKTANGESQLASEELWIADGSADGVIYPVNDHVNKCYSDFQMVYDITDSVKGLNGTGITLKVDTFKMENKSFDGRIKLIALVLAYDDGDDDVINYWLDTTQKWTKGNITTVFDTKELTGIYGADLTNIALSSADGSYKVNDEILLDPYNHESGNYFQYNTWLVTDNMKEGKQTEFVSTNVGTGTYSSLKNVLTLLRVYSGIEADVSFATEYTNTCFAGTNNTVTITVNSNKSGKYDVELWADGLIVNYTEIDVDGETKVLLTDPTVRPVDETTVNGANNTNVVYTVDVMYRGYNVASANKTVPVLFNGNLGYDYEYGMAGFEDFYKAVITGDVVIDVKDASSYMGAAVLNRTDVWNIDLDSNSKLVNAFVYIPYNWFNAKSYNESEGMFNVTFNNNSIVPFSWIRDQGNMGTYGKYGYGVLAYDVTEHVAAGENTLVLNKINPTPAVYPSVLVYTYDTKGGNFKEVTIINYADLLANSYNNAGRVVQSQSIIMSNMEGVNSTVYILAAGAQAGESNIIINGKEFVDVWSGTSSTTDLFKADISDVVSDTNYVSFVATGSTILALPQILVTESDLALTIDSIAAEYTSVPSAYAGTNNTLTVSVSASKAGEYSVDLFVDGVCLETVKVNLTNETTKVKITDPTIRPVDETTVNGANNTQVKYEIVLSDNKYFTDASVTLPVLYNGNLGHDMEYNVTGFEDLLDVKVTGDIVIDVKDVSSYMGAAVLNRTDVWAVNLENGSSFNKALIFIPYNWFNGKTYTEDLNMFNVTFNGAAIAPVSWLRDQGNLGNYGMYGYGVFAYDVSDLIANGDNTLVINKANPTPAVYPSVLVYMYDVEGSTTVKHITIINGADLLANSYNVAERIVSSNSEIKTDVSLSTNTTLYILAASAQKGESNIIVNGKEYADVWNGTGSTTDLFKADITDIAKDTNAISFVATGSTILALPQIIVTTQDISTTLTAKALTTTYDSGKSFTVTVKNGDGMPVKGIKLALKVYTGKKSKTYYVTTNANGVAPFASASKLAIGTHKVEITSADSTYIIKKTTSKIKVSKAKTTVKAPKISVKAKKNKYFKVTVKNKATKKAVKNIKVKVKVYTGKKAKTYSIKTNSKGVAKLNTKSIKVGTHKVVVSSGNAKYTISAKSKIVVKK